MGHLVARSIPRLDRNITVIQIEVCSGAVSCVVIDDRRHQPRSLQNPCRKLPSVVYSRGQHQHQQQRHKIVYSPPCGSVCAERIHQETRTILTVRPFVCCHPAALLKPCGHLVSIRHHRQFVADDLPPFRDDVGLVAQRGDRTSIFTVPRRSP